MSGHRLANFSNSSSESGSRRYAVESIRICLPADISIMLMSGQFPFQVFDQTLPATCSEYFISGSLKESKGALKYTLPPVGFRRLQRVPSAGVRESGKRNNSPTSNRSVFV